MMQKFLVAPEHVYDSPDPDDRRKLTEYYLASEVDALLSSHVVATDQSNLQALHDRIAELEKALRDVRGELESYSGLRTEHQDWSDAFRAIDTALMAR